MLSISSRVKFNNSLNKYTYSLLLLLVYDVTINFLPNKIWRWFVAFHLVYVTTVTEMNLINLCVCGRQRGGWIVIYFLWWRDAIFQHEEYLATLIFPTNIHAKITIFIIILKEFFNMKILDFNNLWRERFTLERFENLNTKTYCRRQAMWILMVIKEKNCLVCVFFFHFFFEWFAKYSTLLLNFYEVKSSFLYHKMCLKINRYFSWFETYIKKYCRH